MPRLIPDAPFIHLECEVTDDCTFGRYVEVGRGSRIAHTVMDDYSYCDRYADIANARVGKFSNIAAHARIGATDHPMEKASLHHFHYRSADYFEGAEHDEEWFAHRRSRVATLGHDTWIGAQAMVKPDVTVGNGAVVAAGAIVTKDVEPYAVVTGVPAAPLRMRLPREVADRLIALAWWDWDHDRLRHALPDFRMLSAEAFLDRYEG